MAICYAALHLQLGHHCLGAGNFSNLFVISLLGHMAELMIGVLHGRVAKTGTDGYSEAALACHMLLA